MRSVIDRTSRENILKMRKNAKLYDQQIEKQLKDQATNYLQQNKNGYTKNSYIQNYDQVMNQPSQSSTLLAKKIVPENVTNSFFAGDFYNLGSTLKNSTAEIKDIYTKVSDKMASLNKDLTPKKVDEAESTVMEYTNPE